MQRPFVDDSHKPKLHSKPGVVVYMNLVDAN